MKTYIVLREHHGDRAYARWDIRKADPMSVAHLVANGVLIAGEDADAHQQEMAETAARRSAESGAEAQTAADEVLENKAEPAAPKNKAQK